MQVPFVWLEEDFLWAEGLREAPMHRLKGGGWEERRDGTVGGKAETYAMRKGGMRRREEWVVGDTQEGKVGRNGGREGL